MKSKTKRFHIMEVSYEESHWKLLASLRETAIEIMEVLRELSPLVYGSLARGDVHKGSDIDIVIPYVIPSYMLEIYLSSFTFIERRLTQATPWQLIKGQIELSDATITFPLVQPTRMEHEFYRFGGFLTIDRLYKNERISGVDKRLVCIEPTETGHTELSICGREHEIARRLNISIDIVTERVQVLQRRDKVGRTGIFVSQALHPDQTFEAVVRDLTSRNTQFRRRAR